MLKRKHARLCLCLFYGGVAVLALGSLTQRFPQAAPLTDGLMVCAVLMLVGAGLILSKYLRCPNCGKRYARPRWNVFHTDYCPNCRKPFVYDDDTEGMNQ